MHGGMLLKGAVVSRLLLRPLFDIELIALLPV
jgi:hypothetical protein